MMLYSEIKKKLNIAVSNAQSDELAFITHFLHNYKYDLPKIYEEKFKKYICNYFQENNIEVKDIFPIKWDIPFPPSKDPDFTFIDLFAGIGGFRIPLQELGGNCVFSSESNNHAKRSYELNFGEIPFGDITKLDINIVPKHDVLCAGFPCQPFSISGKMKGFEDTRGTLIYYVFKIIKEKQPKVILLENVKHLIYHDNNKTFMTIVRHLEELGYIVSSKVLNATDFGLPQNRERIIIVGHKSKKFDFDQIIESPKQVLKNFLDKKNDFEYLQEPYTILENQTKQVSGLVFAGYRNKTIRKAGVRPGTEHLSRVHKQPNRIYSTEGVHPALPSQESSGRFWIWHKNKVRKLTIHECYRIMGFPNKFKFIDNRGELYRQIGNSVAIPMVKAVAQVVKKSYYERSKKMVEALLDRSYKQAMLMVASGEAINTSLTPSITNHLTEILNKSESAKAVLTVIFTSLVYKKLHPEQDIRVHQAGMENGYSGRTFDTRYITPFLKKNKFPAMAESGWLTRSLEQRSPYNSNYSGSIRPSELKQAFLEIIDFIQKGQNLDDILSYILQGLIIQRNRNQINLAKPFNLPIAIIINHLKKHFSYKYVSDGAARLPVLALYAIYQSLIFEVKRYEGKKLLNLESHTSADSRSGRIGDIDVIDERGSAFEAVEVKHGIAITRQLVIDAHEKFEKTQVKRYYLLSTVDIDSSQKNEIECEVVRIANIHGCHVIVNGLITSLNYYLRLLSDTSRFIEHYVDLLQSDTALKFEHKVAWNTIIAQRE